jgi:hypothetical protein
VPCQRRVPRLLPLCCSLLSCQCLPLAEPTHKPLAEEAGKLSLLVSVFLIYNQVGCSNEHMICLLFMKRDQQSIHRFVVETPGDHRKPIAQSGTLAASKYQLAIHTVNLNRDALHTENRHSCSSKIQSIIYSL